MGKSNITKANQDIRDYLEDHGVTQKEMGARLGFSEIKISRMMSRELPEHDKEHMIRIIDAICEARDDPYKFCEDVKPFENLEEPASEAVQDNSEEEPVVPGDAGYRFKVGDRVKLPSKKEQIGTVSDIWSSLVQSCVMYAVDTEGGHRGLYMEDQLEPAPIPITYTFSVTLENNVAVVAMIANQEEKTWVYARGHAHILHDGETGMAQAVSFAAKRMFESLDTMNQDKSKRIYFKD